MKAEPLRVLSLMLLGMNCIASSAQDHLPAQELPFASNAAVESSEVPRVPGLAGLLRGLNAGLTISGLHDGQSGWATIAQPAIGYSFNDVFSVDVTVPIYMYRLAGSRARRPKPKALLVNQRGEPGDVTFGLHAQIGSRLLGYQATLSATAPTGDTLYGLSTGRATFDLSNHLDHAFRHLTPELEMGVGDSSTLINPLVTRNFTSLGPLAHFQAGVALPLFWGASFESNAYEQLPIGDQKIYRSVTRRGQTSLVVAGRSVTEDNGFTSALDIPLDGHTTLSSYYTRSLRFRDDVVSFGITYVLRRSKPPRENATYDEQMIDAAQQMMQMDDGKVSTTHNVQASR